MYHVAVRCQQSAVLFVSQKKRSRGDLKKSNHLQPHLSQDQDLDSSNTKGMEQYDYQ